jgi:hypothetical protein
MFPCPVCGYLTLAEPPGSYEICKVCGWEDDALQLEFPTSRAGGANETTLLDAQRKFANAAVRMARRHPAFPVRLDRDPSWRPIDPNRDRFPDFDDLNHERAPGTDARLYYWRETFWNRDRAS